MEVQALAYATDVSGQHLRSQESVENGLRAINLVTGDENPRPVHGLRCWTVASLLRMGDLDGARPHALFLRDLAGRLSTPPTLAANCMQMNTTLSCLEGDWKAGREYSERGFELSPLNVLILSPRILLEYETGESAQEEVHLEQLLDAMRRGGPDQLQTSARTAMEIPAIARITGVSDRLEIAEATGEAVLSEPAVVPLRALWAKTGLALVAVQKGDQSAAEEHYAYFLGQRGTMILTVISVDRLLGLLSQTMADLDQAAGHFEDALDFCRKAGYRPELAWTCYDYAEMLVDRDGDGDRTKALSLLDESLAVSSELGMRPLMERVLSKRESFGA